MNTEIKRVIISVDRKSYEIAQQNYIKKVKLEDALLKEIYHLLPDVKLNETSLFKDTLSEFYTLIELVYKDTNTLRLTGSKLVQLLEINTSELVRISNKYNEVKHFEPANIKDFSTYVDDEAEKQRYILSKRVANLCNDMAKEHNIYAMNLLQGFNGLVNYDRETQEYLVHVPYIKNTRY